MLLEFCGSSGREGEPDDHQQMELQRHGPFEFLVGLREAEGPPVSFHRISHTDPLAFLSWGGWMAHASCRMPAVASRRGESPMLEIMPAAAPVLFTVKPPPTMRRPQKTTRKSHPSGP